MTDDPREKFRRLLNSEEETQAEPPPVAPRVEASSTPRAGFPALDKDNMPLPRRVSETAIGGLCLASVALYEYYSIASSLPAVSDLQQRTSQFETTRILDRNGNLLYEIVDPNAGRRTSVPLARISPTLGAR